MKTTLISIVLFIGATLSGLAQGEHYVAGYYRGNGTYVAPHYQTKPNRTVFDNYSTQSNYNPHTGAYGTVNPFAVRTIQAIPGGTAFTDRFGLLQFAP